MRKVTNLFLVLLVLADFSLQVGAQTVLTLPQKSSDKTSVVLSKQKRSVAMVRKKSVYDIAKELKGAMPLSDKMVYGNYVVEQGKNPVLPSFVSQKIAKEEGAVSYKFTGVNEYAGLGPDGSTAVPGFVDFNLNPFSCDTVSSSEGISPYSYEANGKLYCFKPYSSDGYSYPTITRTTFDGNTLKLLDQKKFDVEGKTADHVPYIMAYDDQRNIVYAISMKTDYDENNFSTGTNYYLNILDTATCTLKQLGLLGTYAMNSDVYRYVPKGLACAYGTLYIELYDDSVTLGKVDPNTCLTTKIGRTNMPIKYVYGLQPMVYDNETSKLLINHYDFLNGTQYFYVDTSLPWGAVSDTLKTKLIENAPTGFTYFYQRPETVQTYNTHQLPSIKDFSITVPSGSKTAKISFTCPPPVYDTGESIPFNSWSSKKLRFSLSSTNGTPVVQGIPSTLSYGQHVEGTIELPDGLSILTAVLYPADEDLSIDAVRTSQTAFVGYDVPVNVSDPAVSIENQKAEISWTAPTRGRYHDFDANFDDSDISYEVVRSDGYVVGKGISGTSVVDETLSDTLRTYYYTIYASSHGQINSGSKTNVITAGLFAPMPYKNDFTKSTCLDGWTVINANDDGLINTWKWSPYTEYVFAASKVSDDWLITPSLHLNSSYLYNLSYDVRGGGLLRTTFGKGTTIAAQSTILAESKATIVSGILNGVPIYDWIHKDLYVNPSEDGLYNFGFYDYNATDKYTWSIDNVSVDTVAVVTAPAKVSKYVFTPAAKGALSGTLSFTLPVKDISGKAITSLAKVTAYDADGKELASSTDVSPGAAMTLEVKAVQGWNRFKVVAANAYGEGWPVDTTAFVGLDKPRNVTRFKAGWGDDFNIASLSWDAAPTVGVNGGYVNPDSVSYKLYKYDTRTNEYTELAQVDKYTDAEVQILDASKTTQNQYVFGIRACDKQGESDYSRTAVVLGNPYALPLLEPFGEKGVAHAPWVLYAGINDQTWTVDDGSYNKKVQPENNDGIQLVFIDRVSGKASGSVMSPICDFTKAVAPKLYVWVNHSDNISKDAFVTVDATMDGMNIIALGDTDRIAGNAGWVEHVFDLSKLNGHKAQIAVTGYLPNPQSRIFIDNFAIREAAGKDLSLASISRPYSSVVGDTANIEVDVRNLGAETAKNYSVLFYVNGDVVDEVDPQDELASGKTKTVNFTLPITAGKKNILYSAEVLWDDDENKSNNQSSDVELNPEQLPLPAPTDLAVNGQQLTWKAPEEMDGRPVTLDFEDQPSFLTDNIAGWSTFDGDGHMTTYFNTGNGTTWPYMGQPLAWMVWDPQEAGCPTAAVWLPKDGEKCLVSWGNYGADAEGHDNSKEPDNDWLISPEIKGGTDFSFMTSSNGSNCVLEVLTSSTDRNPSSFTNKLKVITYPSVQTSTWYDIQAQLPDDAKYVALHVAQNNFGLLVDDLHYTLAKSPVLKGYDVYYGNDVTSFTSATNSATDKSGLYSVSAVYDIGESALTNTVSTGIADQSLQNIVVYGEKGSLVVKGADGLHVDVVSVSGQKWAAGIASSLQVYHVPAGVYLVDVNKKVYKVFVK